MVQPQREPTTEIMRSRGCVQYNTNEEHCYTTYAKEGETVRTIYPDPPSGEDQIPDTATVEYNGNEYDAELCFRYQEGRGPVPGLCWDVTTPA